MSARWLDLSLARRSFLARLGIGVGALSAAGAASSPVFAQAPAAGSWKPARHTQDDWLDENPAQHRLVIDTITPDGLSLGFLFGANYLNANRDGYGLADRDLGLVIVLRHKSTSFGYNDAMWAKYGKNFSAHAIFTDPKTNQPPTANLRAMQMEGLMKRGIRFAVCETATRNIARAAVKDSGSDADAMVKEMAANLVPGARLVPAGIVIVNRAQERGYSLASAG